MLLEAILFQQGQYRLLFEVFSPNLSAPDRGAMIGEPAGRDIEASGYDADRKAPMADRSGELPERCKLIVMFALPTIMRVDIDLQAPT